MSEVPDNLPSVDAMILLADSAQVAEGKLYILGGGLTVIGPRPQPVGIAIRIQVPWDRANIAHLWKLELLDEDGQPVTANEKPVMVGGRFEAGRPAGLRAGTPLSVPLAINFATLPLQPGRAYTWRLSIDDDTRTNWRAGFSVRPKPQPAQ
ncbi:MAG: hypothetical protein V3V01_11035 [Acidimicrobiales bacterium]